MYVLRCCALGVTSRMSCWLLSSAGRRNSNTFLHPLEKVQKTSQPEASMNEWLGRSVPISNLLLCMYIYIHIIFLCVYTYCMYSYVFHTSFILCISETWKVLYWNSNCRIIILVKRSVEKNWKGKVELSECIYSNWLMYIILYLSIHVCNTVTYLVVNLKIFDVHTDTERWSRARWPPRLGFLSNIGCVKLWGCWTNTKG